MKHDVFVRQPSVELHRGIRIKKDTKITYESKHGRQTVENLTLYIEAKESGVSGLNSYETESRIKIRLNEGDVLLFEEERGYYLPVNTFCTPAQAAEDLASLKNVTIPG